MSTKLRLDNLLVTLGLVATRSQAETYIKLKQVEVDSKIITKPGYFVDPSSSVKLVAKEKFVSRAGLKLASVGSEFGLNFKDKTVLDVGSSTGGFTDYALQHGAKKIIAVDVGSDQLHHSLRFNPKVEIHEQTDIRDYLPSVNKEIDIVLIDVSFISLREILPHISKIINYNSQVVAMFKPQFESGSQLKNKGVIKNDKIRRKIIKDFELWLKRYFVIKHKADSKVSGEKGNLERFYLLTKIKR